MPPESRLGSIRPLSPAAAAQISSSAQLTSLNEVVAALVQNSLDAAATRLRVVLDYSRGNCSVEDDGTGILAAEFSEAGGLGKPHHTSRQAYSQCHGFKGSFIASLATLAVVTVTSHHRSQTTQNSMTLHRGKVVVRNTPSLASERLLEYPHGTCVSVRDLFGSMPVRVRQRAVASADVTKQWTALVWTLMSLLISWPTGVTLTIQAMSAMSDSLAGTTPLIPRRISFKSVDSTILAVRTPKLLAQAKLADPVQWEPISATAGPFVIKGCIAHAPAASRRAQFISLGVVPIANTVETSSLYSEINRVFADSAFSRAQDEDDDMLKFAGFADPAKRTMKRNPERWPMFYFKVITAERLSVDQLFGSQKMLSMLVDLLRAVCTEYLTRSGLKTTNIELKQPTASKRLFSHTQNAIKSSASPLDKWGRVKQGCSDIPKIDPRSFPRMPLVSNSGNLTRPPFEADPVSSSAPKSMKQLVSTWKNPVFETATSRIPQLAPVTSSSASGPNGGLSSVVSFNTVSMAVKSNISKAALLRARVLRQVDNKFILVALPKDTQAQSQEQDHLLVVVDQHAADERIRLEELMASYFPTSPPNETACSEPVAKSISFSLFEEEIGLLLRYRKHLNTWGITYDIMSPSSLPDKENTQAVVTISTIPPSIHARCVQDPQLIISAIRAELWSLADSGHSTGPRLADLDSRAPHAFVPRFRTCPVGILDLLHSRACRSAVMFNDELSLAQCEELMQKLAGCAFPFQCAHGRPSMVPLLDLGRQDEGGLWMEYSKTPRDMWAQYLKR